MNHKDLVLGVDGGGTKTLAWLAECDGDGKYRVVGRGQAGAANPQITGFPGALDALNQAIDQAFSDSRMRSARLPAACIALAGSDRQPNRLRIQQWADQRRLATSLAIVHDADPVLAAGTRDGWGIALIAGTGSFAFARTVDGRAARVGGWGHLLGDEGGGYWIALQGLQAVVRAADGRRPATQITPLILRHLGIDQVGQLVTSLHGQTNQQQRIASLAPGVFQAADAGDGEAMRILDDAAQQLAQMVACLAAQLHFGSVFPLACAGGALRQNAMRRRLDNALTQQGVAPDPLCYVENPVAGAVQIACRAVLNEPT